VALFNTVFGLPIHVMKLSDWARKNGLDYKTAYHLFRSGKFPALCSSWPPERF
jgi:hypothetical protein